MTIIHPTTPAISQIHENQINPHVSPPPPIVYIITSGTSNGYTGFNTTDDGDIIGSIVPNTVEVDSVIMTCVACFRIPSGNNDIIIGFDRDYALDAIKIGDKTFTLDAGDAQESYLGFGYVELHVPQNKSNYDGVDPFPADGETIAVEFIGLRHTDAVLTAGTEGTFRGFDYSRLDALADFGGLSRSRNHDTIKTEGFYYNSADSSLNLVSSGYGGAAGGVAFNLQSLKVGDTVIDPDTVPMPSTDADPYFSVKLTAANSSFDGLDPFPADAETIAVNAQITPKPPPPIVVNVVHDSATYWGFDTTGSYGMFGSADPDTYEGIQLTELVWSSSQVEVLWLTTAESCVLTSINVNGVLITMDSPYALTGGSEGAIDNNNSDFDGTNPFNPPGDGQPIDVIPDWVAS